MTDRLFTECCYGTKFQHRADEACPKRPRQLDDLDRINDRLLLNVGARGMALRDWLESVVISTEHPGTDPLYTLLSIGDGARKFLAINQPETPMPIPTPAPG